MSNNPITETQKERVVELHKQGVSRSQIVKICALSHPTVLKILRRAGFGDDIRKGNYGNKPPEGIGEEILKLYNSGYNSRQVAEHLGVGKAYVLNVIREKADEVKSTSRSPISAEKFITVWQKSATIDEAALTLGLDRASVLMRGYKYKKKGIPLKALRSRHPNSYDWGDLAELAATMLDEDDEAEE